MTKLDPVTVEIMWSRLVSIAEQQARALYRGSFTTSTSEVEDYCSTLHDAEGRMIAQSVSSGTISMLTGQAQSIRMLATRFSGSVEAGDAIIWNDPWLLAGHKYDVVMASPFFRAGRLTGWTVTSLHAVDIGGRGFSAAAQDTYEEGLTFPPIKLFRAGKTNQDVEDLIRANVRQPDQVIGDFLAQAAANAVGAAKVQTLLDEYELEGLHGIADEILGRSERAMREAIDQLEDGRSYSHSVQLDGFEEPLQVSCTITVKGDEIFADLTGTSPQVDGAINAVGHVAHGRVVHAVKCALLPHVPNNEGVFRPISTYAPEGTLVNARHPAPTAARHVLHFFISAAAFGALAQVQPTLPGLIADSGAGMIQSVREQDPHGAPRDYWIRFNHGMGATPVRDGYSGMCAPNNVGTTPIEIVEARTSALFLKKEIVPDTGGAGMHRGGHAQEYAFVVRSGRPTTVACMFDRVKHPPLGFLGGLDGSPAQVSINGDPVHPKGRYTLNEGDVMLVRGPGGGGFFSPTERSPDLVRQDVVDGLVSSDRARELYGVAVHPTSHLLDVAETARLRSVAARPTIALTSH